MNMRFSRRSLLKSSVAAVAMPAVGATIESKSISSVVDTNCGKVRGVVVNRVHVYRGIPYGASTEGANRFMPPHKPESWTGVRDAFQNGHSSPQNSPAPGAIGWGLRGNALQGEDCLVLNVFSNGVNDGRKRPVMVWIHGGGYTYGSGSSLGYDGGNLARTGDVTVVSINHRLNLFGHLYLGGAGSDFIDSGNVGLLDIVASLEWVRDNVARFGGDPGNVTIFGESGGGGKVSTLLATPGAKGLFHRAIVQSGSAIRLQERGRAARLAEAVLHELGLQRTELAKLQELPFARLIAAIGPAIKSLGPP